MSQKVLEGLELIKDLCISDILNSRLVRNEEQCQPEVLDAHRVIHWCCFSAMSIYKRRSVSAFIVLAWVYMELTVVSSKECLNEIMKKEWQIKGVERWDRIFCSDHVLSWGGITLIGSLLGTLNYGQIMVGQIMVE